MAAGFANEWYKLGCFGAHRNVQMVILYLVGGFKHVLFSVQTPFKHVIFSVIYGIILPIGFHIFFKMVIAPPTRNDPQMVVLTRELRGMRCAISLFGEPPKNCMASWIDSDCWFAYCFYIPPSFLDGHSIFLHFIPIYPYFAEELKPVLNVP